MKIRIDEFKPTYGVAFTITSETDAERALLFACVSDENNLIAGNEETDFVLTLPVSN